MVEHASTAGRITTLAVDPGRAKCGLAVLAPDGEILAHCIAAADAMQSTALALVEQYSPQQILLGDSTSSAQWRARLAAWLPGIPITVVDETGSTEAARALYWQVHPPRGWRRLVPLSLQVPPEPIDDFAAVVLARRFLGNSKHEQRNPKPLQSRERPSSRPSSQSNDTSC